MTNDPYNSPESEVESESNSKRPGSLWKGVVIGGVADIGGTIIMSTIMAIVYLAMLWSPEMTPENIEEAMQLYVEDTSSFNNIWSFIGIALGLGFSVFGGYICAIFAREKWKKAALILAAILSGYSLIMGSEVYQLGVILSLTLLSVAAIFIGSWLRAR